MLQIQSPFQQFFGAGGDPLDNGRIYIGTTNQNPEVNPIVVYWDETLTIPAVQPIQTMNGYIVRAGTPARLFTSANDYSMTVKNKRGAVVFSVLSATSLSGLQDSLASVSSQNNGGALVGFKQGNDSGFAAGAVARNLYTKSREVVSLLDFIPEGTNTQTTDCSDYIQDAVDYAQLITGSTFTDASNSCTLHAPASIYKITKTINIPGNIRLEGDGNNATIFNLVSPTVTVAFLVGPSGDNQYLWGGRLSGFRVNCDGGAAVCDGIKLQTGAVNSVITQTVFDDILVWNCRDGFILSGVLYMLDFTNCKVVGTTRHGFTAEGNKEIVYNSFRNIEVTNVASTAYAFWFGPDLAATMGGTYMSNITADGCCYFVMPYSHIDGLIIEGIAAAATPNTVAITIGQIAELSNTALINIPNAKCAVGIYVLAQHINIHGLRTPGNVNTPEKLITFAPASSGILTGVFAEATGTLQRLEDYSDPDVLANWKIAECTSNFTKISSFNSNVVGALPTPSKAFNGNIATLPKGTSPFSRPYLCQNTASSGYKWTELVTYDGKSASIGTDLSGEIAPLSLGNPSDPTPGRFWSVGPSASGSFLVFNQASAGVYIGNGGTAWVSTSDERSKDIIAPIESAVAKVQTLRAVIGKYKNDADQTRHPFLIAQDVKLVLPEAVHTDDNGMLGVSYSDVIPLLVAAIKELQAEINSLK